MTTDADLLAISRDAMGRSLRAIDACIAKVDEMLTGEGGEYDSKLASHLAYLSEKLAPMVREFRQLEKHDADAAKKLPPKKRVVAILQQLKDLPLEHRRAAIDKAQGLLEEGVLSR